MMIIVILIILLIKKQMMIDHNNNQYISNASSPELLLAPNNWKFIMVMIVMMMMMMIYFKLLLHFMQFQSFRTKTFTPVHEIVYVWRVASELMTVLMFDVASELITASGSGRWRVREGQHRKRVSMPFTFSQVSVFVHLSLVNDQFVFAFAELAFANFCQTKTYQLSTLIVCYVWMLPCVWNSCIWLELVCVYAVSYTHLTLPTRRTV